MEPNTYLGTARLLADRVRVVIPDLFALPERWTFDHTLDCLELTLDDLEIDRATLLGHSFGGGLELGLAARTSAQASGFVMCRIFELHGFQPSALARIDPGVLSKNDPGRV